MAKMKAVKRRGLTAAQRAQVRRVQERLTDSLPETWIDNVEYHREQMMDLYEEIERLWDLSKSPESLEPAVLRELAQRVEALGDLAAFVGLTTTMPKLSPAEQRRAWQTVRKMLRREILKTLGIEP
jgi:hypothetical protein